MDMKYAGNPDGTISEYTDEGEPTFLSSYDIESKFGFGLFIHDHDSLFVETCVEDGKVVLSANNGMRFATIAFPINQIITENEAYKSVVRDDSLDVFRDASFGHHDY